MPEYHSAKAAADHWFELVEMVQAGFIRSPDLAELCANAHNHDAGTVTTDCAYISELETKWMLDDLFGRVYQASDRTQWATWFAYRRYRRGPLSRAVRRIDGDIELHLSRRGMWRSR